MKKILLFTITFIFYKSLVSQSSIAPNLENWAITPTNVVLVPHDQGIVNALNNAIDYTDFCSIAAGAEQAVLVQLPTLSQDGMLTYSFDSTISGVVVQSFESADQVTWTPLELNNYHNGYGDDLQKVDFPARLGGKWLKVVFKNMSTRVRKLKELSLYQFTSGRNQYFLMIGASITESAGRHTAWKETINARLGASYQPVIFNWAVSGDNTQGILNKVTKFLKAHPKAAYVLVETGGNDISQNRPLTYEKSLGSTYTNMLDSTKAILQKIIDAGKTPVYSRISFRNYPLSVEGNIVKPSIEGGAKQEYGSLPYNFEIDKIIKEYSPLFWDEQERRGVLDFYQFTLNNQNWLLTYDGTHFFGTEAYHIREFWTDYAFKYIYTGQRAPVVPYTEFVEDLLMKANVAVSLAEATKQSSDVWSARILVEQIASRAQRVPLLDRLESIVQINITQQPANLTLVAGAQATFSVVVTGAGTLSYQWQKNGADIAGANTATYTFTCGLADHGTTYRCAISNAKGTTLSSSALLTVRSTGGGTQGLTARYYTNVYASLSANATLTRVDPNIDFSWGSAAPAAGVSANAFAVKWSGKITPTATGLYTFYTQSDDGARLWVNQQAVVNKWQYQGLAEWSGTIQLTAGVAYDIVLEYFEGNGDATCKLLWSSAAVQKQVVPSAVLSPEVVVSSAPAITQHPVSLAVYEWTPVTFTVVASGTGPLAYKWQRNGVDIAGAVSASYTFSASLADHNASYKCVVSNALGAATSNVATLVVTQLVAPKITNGPFSQAIFDGDTVKFSVEATGTAPLAFQWYKNGNLIPQAQASSYTHTATLADDSSIYSVAISNQAGSVNSVGVLLRVQARTTPPHIVLQPLSIAVVEHQPATFTVAAQGSELSYQWYKNGQSIVGANSASYTQQALLAEDGAVFSCVVTNSWGADTSANAVLSVSEATVVHGLSARYYTNMYASIPSVPTLSRLEADVNFNWGLGSPAAAISSNAFSARWKGFIKVPEGGPYTFYTFSDDGVRLWVGGQFLIDKWVYQSPTEWSATTTLQAGVYYSIQIDYFEGSGDAICKLYYSTANTPKQLVPSLYLFPENHPAARQDGTFDEAQSLRMEVFPSPFEETLRIDYNNDAYKDQAFIKIEALTGQSMYEGVLPLSQGANSLQLEVASLKSGVYILHVNDKRQVVFKR